MATPDRIVAAIDAAKLSAEGTRYAPALKLASQIVSASTLPRREVVLISDFQKIGWANRNEIGFPPGTAITPVDLGGATAADVAVSQVTTDRDSTGERDHVTVAARLDQHRVRRRRPVVGDAGGRRPRRADEARRPCRRAARTRWRSRRSPCRAARRRAPCASRRIR